MSRTKVKQNVIDATFGNILEYVSFPADGRTISTTQGNITSTNVTALQLINSTSFADINGSSISYQPPTGTVYVEYRCEFTLGYSNYAAPLPMWQALVDGTAVNQSRAAWYSGASNGPYDGRFISKAIIHINGSSDAIASGTMNTWSSSKIIKSQINTWSGQPFNLHRIYHWNNSVPGPIIQPSITIIAYK